MKNTDFTIETIGTIISSEASLLELMDMINEMDLEIVDATKMA